MKNDRKRWWSEMYILLMLFLSGCAPAITASPAKIEARQAVVVKTADWNASTAVLQAYEKEREGSFWVAVGKKIPVVIGRNGLGWGVGLHQRVGAKSGPIKKEGDEKSPAGVFLISSAFGYDPPEMMTWVRIPYQQATANHQCVDDVHSTYYNRIVDVGKVKPDWSSSEAMLRNDHLYHIGATVDHNTHPVVRGSGSCIFLHAWEGPAKGTSGCTAMDSEDLEMLILWLVPEAKPVLIQLPEEEYAFMQESLGLP